MMSHLTTDQWLGIGLGVASLIIGIAGIAYAVYENRQRARVETIVKEALGRAAGQIRVIYMNAEWCDQHVRKIGQLLSKDEPEKSPLRSEIVDALRDAASCRRQISLAHAQIRGIQTTLFKGSIEITPEILSDDVKEANKRMNEGQPVN